MYTHNKILYYIYILLYIIITHMHKHYRLQCMADRKNQYGKQNAWFWTKIMNDTTTNRSSNYIILWRIVVIIIQVNIILLKENHASLFVILANKK